MAAPLDNGNDTPGDDTPTRHSSKLSLGSSPSVLSGDEGDGDDEGVENEQSGNGSDNNNDSSDHHLDTTLLGLADQKDGRCFGVDEGNDDHGNLDAFALADTMADGKAIGMDKSRVNGQGDPDNSNDDDMANLFDGSLPSSSTSDDDLDDSSLEHDSASPLSSVPDDFPLSPETQDDQPLLSLPTHNTISSDTQSPIPPSPMTRRQKQKQQLQVESTSPSTTSPRETVSGKKRGISQSDPTTTVGKTRKRKRRSRNKGGRYQASDCSHQSSSNNDKNREHENVSSNHDASQRAIQSRRLSIHGRAIYNKSTLDTNADSRTEEGDDNNDRDENGNKMEGATISTNKQTPLAPTKHHNNTTDTLSSLPKSKASTQQQQQHVSKDIDGVQKVTGDNNNEEKENTPVILNQDDFSGTNDSLYTNALEDSEKLPTNEEEQDNQQQHKEAFDALTHIEVEFARLRDKLYQEKMAELNEEAMMIANGTHPNLVTLMTEIEEKKGRRISTAKAWRKYQHDNFKRQFEGFEYQANVHFISRKSSMRRKILAEMNGKHWRLEDEQVKLNESQHKRGNPIPDTNALTFQKQGKWEETMDLQDINDAIGFPRAPQVAGLSSQDIHDDLLLLGLGPPGSH